MLTEVRMADWAKQIATQKFTHAPQHVGRLITCDGPLISATGFPYPIGTQAKIAVSDIGAADTHMLAEVIGFRSDYTILTRLLGPQRIGIGAQVIAQSAKAGAVCGDALLGRVIDALGNPLDGLPRIMTHQRWPLKGRPVPALARDRVRQPFDCGVRAINALLTLGVGQRAAIMAGSGVGKSVLLGQILAGADADRIVVGLIGERGREISDFLETKLPPAVRAKSVVVATPADEPALLRVRAAEQATAIAEAFRSEGHHVLLLIDSLTRVAHAQREIGLALGEPPAMKAYPPSVFSLIPNLVERAGNDTQSGGAITALYTVLADGDDVQDPVVDAARAIVDGHIILSRSMAEAQVYPAIDVGRSISRVMADLVPREQANSAAAYRQLWANYAENHDLVLMGAWKAGSDPVLDAAIAARPAMLNFLRQSPDEIVSMADSQAQLIADYGAIGELV
jgi:flagellum-specific ATP synthase